MAKRDKDVITLGSGKIYVKVFLIPCLPLLTCASRRTCWATSRAAHR